MFTLLVRVRRYSLPSFKSVSASTRILTAEGWKGALAAVGGSQATMCDGESTSMLGWECRTSWSGLLPKTGGCHPARCGLVLPCMEITPCAEVLWIGAMQFQGHNSVCGATCGSPKHTVPPCALVSMCRDDGTAL